MNGKKNRKVIYIYTAIGIVLIVLICGVLYAVSAAENASNEELDALGKHEITGEVKEEDTVEEKLREDGIDEFKEGEAKPEGEVLQEDNKVQQVPQVNPVPNEKKAEAKPLVVPQAIPESEAFAVYNNTLIIGDSRTEGFKLYSGVKNASYFCMKAMTIDRIVEGKSANVDGNNVSVYNLLDGGTYEKVIIGVGLNELGWNHIETFLSDYGTLIDKVKEKQPNAVVYLQAVLPVSRSKDGSDKVHNNAQVYWYNENIIKLAEEKGATFVNPAAALVDADGFLLDESTTDGVHLNSAYCKVWAKYLAELL